MRMQEMRRKWSIAVRTCLFLRSKNLAVSKQVFFGDIKTTIMRPINYPNLTTQDTQQAMQYMQDKYSAKIANRKKEEGNLQFASDIKCNTNAADKKSLNTKQRHCKSVVEA